MLQSIHVMIHAYRASFQAIIVKHTFYTSCEPPAKQMLRSVQEHVERPYAAAASCASERAARWRASSMRSMLWSLNMRLETTMPCSQKHRHGAVSTDARQGLQCHVRTQSPRACKIEVSQVTALKVPCKVQASE